VSVKALGEDALNEIPEAAAEFTRFYREAYPGAVRLAWLLTHDHGAAEDVVQDAFVRVNSRLTSIEHPKAYLRAAIVNGCRDRARSAGRADAAFRRISVTTEPSALDRPSELLDAIAHLPYRHRAVLALRYWADLPEAEIAEIVGVKPATVRSITARALARLKRELPDDH
jgi:RNA polymerase sigma factor (sigma-70 family)